MIKNEKKKRVLSTAALCSIPPEEILQFCPICLKLYHVWQLMETLQLAQEVANEKLRSEMSPCDVSQWVSAFSRNN